MEQYDGDARAQAQNKHFHIERRPCAAAAPRQQAARRALERITFLMERVEQKP